MVLIARHYWPRAGAASVRLQGVAEAARGRGWAIIVLTTNEPDQPPSSEGPVGEKIIRLRGDTSTGISGRRAMHLVAFAWRAWLCARQLGRADVVLCDPPPTSGIAALFIARRLRARCVYYLADSWADMVHQKSGRRSGAVSALVRSAENACLRQSDGVMAVTARLASAALSKGARQVAMVENGTDVETFSPEGGAWDSPWPEGKRYFLYAGNFGEVHGASVFVHAADLLWKRGLDFGVVFMGYGSERDALESVRQRWPNELKFVAPAPPHVAAAAFRGAVGGLCSIRPMQVTVDARPAKALASLAAGCPLIFSGIGTFADEVLKQNLGWVAEWSPAAVAEILAEALLQCDRSKKRATELAEYARQHFDRRNSAKLAVDFLEHLVAPPTLINDVRNSEE
ncbi:glycosyltransferase [Nakamurella sp. GG22]